VTFLYHAIYRVVLILLRGLHGLTPKLRAGYERRKPLDGVMPWLRERTLTRPIWLHCASGEFEYALPLIRAIKQKNPEQKILVTYFTTSYLKRIEQEPLVDLVLPSPWDTPRDVAAFLDYHQPRALLFARTDVWFEMTRQSSLRNIPVMVFSMTFNKEPRGLKKFFWSWLFQFVDHFFVVSAADREKLAGVVGPERVSVTGDTRYEQCLYRLNLHLPLKINAAATHRKVFVAGSTWPEDEAVLVPFIARHPDLCHWILVPHEVGPEHIEALRAKLLDHRLPVTLYSETSGWDMKGVLIVDTVGVLAHLYKIADLGFVGGSFRKQVHSVMESLACGCLTFVGPHFQNNREAVEFSRLDAGFTVAPVQVCDAANFAEKFIAGHGAWTATQADRLKALVASKARVSGPLYEEILKQF